jgi:hypothetical protein
MAKISTHCDFNKTPAVIVAGYTLHDACAAWPPMADAELNALEEDIKTNGQHEPVALTPTGEVIDGRNRLMACERLGVKPKTFVYEGDPWLYSISKNARRRHMSVDRIAMTVATLATRGEGGDGSNQYGRATGSSEPVAPALSVAQVAKAAGVPETAIKSAKTVLRDGTAEEIDAVRNGRAPLRKTVDRVRDRKRASPPALRLVGTGAKTPSVSDKVIALNDPDRVTKALIAKCADGEWRTLDKLAHLVDAAPSAVKEKLKLLRAETGRGADGQLEYRIPSERNEPLVRAKPVENTPDESYWRTLATEREAEIVEWEAENADLRRRVAELEAENAQLRAAA